MTASLKLTKLSSPVKPKLTKPETYEAMYSVFSTSSRSIQKNGYSPVKSLPNAAQPRYADRTKATKKMWLPTGW